MIAIWKIVLRLNQLCLRYQDHACRLKIYFLALDRRVETYGVAATLLALGSAEAVPFWAWGSKRLQGLHGAIKKQDGGTVLVSGQGHTGPASDCNEKKFIVN